MTDAAAASGLLKLMAWLSPAFPVGSFTYSHGLESAARQTSLASWPPRSGREEARRNRAGEGDSHEPPTAQPSPVSTTADLQDWLTALLRFGSAWNDAVLFAEAWRRQSDGGCLFGLAELGAALAGSCERHLETTQQGAAFVAALHKGWPEPAIDLPDACPYPVAVGVAAAAHGIALEPALAAYLQAFVVNLAQASIRLGVTGQTGAVALVAALEPVIGETAERAARSCLDDLGSAAIVSEVMAMRHETHYSRLFRT